MVVLLAGLQTLGITLQLPDKELLLSYLEMVFKTEAPLRIPIQYQELHLLENYLLVRKWMALLQTGMATSTTFASPKVWLGIPLTLRHPRQRSPINKE